MRFAKLLVMLTMFWAMGASAQTELFQYVRPYMSLLLTGSDAFDGPKPTVITDTGLFRGIGLAPAIGFHWHPLRVELEYHTHWSSTLSGGDDSVKIRAVTLNAILERQLFDGNGTFIPPVGVSVGAGYGSAKVTADFETCLQYSGCTAIRIVHASGSAYAQQLQFGIALGPPDRVQILIGYRKLTSGNLGLVDDQGMPLENNSASFSMTYIGIRANF